MLAVGLLLNDPQVSIIVNNYLLIFSLQLLGWLGIVSKLLCQRYSRVN